MPETHTRTSTLPVLSILRRRWRVFLLVAVAVPLLSAALSATRPKLFQGEARVYLDLQSATSRLGTESLGTSGINETPDRIVETQANLAADPGVAQRALDRVGGSGTLDTFLDRSEVTSEVNADMLVFRVRDRSRARSLTLAQAYAQEFVRYRVEIDTASIKRARAEVAKRLAGGRRTASLNAALEEKEQQLATLEALQTSNAFVVKSRNRVEQVQPRPLRSLLFGLVLGLVLAVAVALVRDLADSRFKDPGEIGEALGLPLLGSIPEPPRKLREASRLVMAEAPEGVHAEAFRMLRANVGFQTLGARETVVLITSATEREGKSTTLANLALAFARAGERVVLADLDLRRPMVDKLFDLRRVPGVADVALGTATLSEALRTIELDRRNDLGDGGSLQVLPAGVHPPDVGEFIASARVGEIVDELRGEADWVFLDAPPLLHVGDPLTLSAHCDRTLIVANTSVLRRPMARRLQAALGTLRARPLGLVVTGDAGAEGYHYYGYEATAAPELPAPREPVRG